MDDRVSQELIPAAIRDVGASGLRFFLRASAEKIPGVKPPAVRSHDSYEHVSVLGVHDVPHGILTEGVAALTISAPVFPGYESPCANKRIGCHCLLLQVGYLVSPHRAWGRQLRREGTSRVF